MVTIEGKTIVIDNPRATLDDKTAFENAVNKLINENNTIINVDLSKTVYIPSELLGYIMGKKRALNSRGMDIKIIANSEPLKKIFDEAKISDFLGV